MTDDGVAKLHHFFFGPIYKNFVYRSHLFISFSPFVYKAQFFATPSLHVEDWSLAGAGVWGDLGIKKLVFLQLGLSGFSCYFINFLKL
jgi:hypothetical protein